MNTSMHLTSESKHKLNALIKEMQKTTGAEMKKVIRNVARDYCSAAKRITPVTPKNAKRWLRIYPGGNKSKAFWKMIGRGSNLFISKSKFDAYSRDARRTQYAVKYGRFVATKQAQNRGMLKSGWMTCLFLLGVQNNTTVRKDSGGNITGVKVNKNYGRVNWAHTSGGVGVIVENTAPAIERVNRGQYPGGHPHHIQEKALRMTMQKTEKILQKMARRVIKRTVGI